MKDLHVFGILVTFISFLTLVSCYSWVNVYNVAKGAPVQIEPSDGTCGSSAARSTIRRPLDIYNLEYGPEDDQQGQEPQFTGEDGFPPIQYQPVKCAADCGRKFPPNPEPQAVYESNDEIVLGDPACTPIKSLPFGRRKRTTASACQISFEGSDLLFSNRTYSFWIKPNTEDNYSNVSVILHERGDFVLVYNRLNPSLTLINQDEVSSGPSPALSPYWNHIGIQYERSEWYNVRHMYLYVNNSLVSTIEKSKPLETFKPYNYAQLSIGSMSLDESLCEVLEVRQCRAVHHSFAVELGSQTQETLPDFSKCLNSSQDIELAIKFTCAALFPSCVLEEIRRPCSSFCERVAAMVQGCDLELETFPDLLMCEAYSVDENCFETDVSFEFGMFRGAVRDFKVYDQMLTTRELFNMAQNKDVDIYPNPSCMCPMEYPVFNYTDFPQLCYSSTRSNSIERNRVGFSDDTYFFSKDFINDGIIEEAKQYGLYWVSTPEIETTSITIDFQRTVSANDVFIELLSPMPSKGLVIYRRNDGIWKPWQYYAKDCASFNMPNDGNILNMDSVVCRRYKDRIVPQRKKRAYGPGQGLTYVNFRTDEYRSGLDEEYGFIDNRFLQFTLTDAVKVELHGLPDNEAWEREDITELKYHAVSEIQVHAGNYTEQSEECNIKCFPGTEKNFPEEEPTENRYKRVAGDECKCECRGLFDRQKAGNQCVPYLDSINPVYGPEAGGTTIVLRGGLLSNNAGEEGQVSLREDIFLLQEPCNVTLWNDTMIICHTLIKSRPMSVNKTYRVKVDHPGAEMYQLYAPEKFTFKPNPDILKIYPLNSIVQGGVFLTVEGNHFDSVAYPLMRVQVKYNKTDPRRQYPVWTLPELCTVRNSTMMVCPTPPIYKYLPKYYEDKLNDNRTSILEENKRKKRSVSDEDSTLLELIRDYVSSLSGATETEQRKKRQVGADGVKINDDDLQFTLGLILDGVPNFRDLEEDLPEFSKVDVLVNPVLTEFSPLVKSIPSKWPSKEVEPQIIGGQNLNKGARMGDYKVTVGHEECAVTDLLGNLLTFVPPLDEPDDEGLHSQDGGKIVKLKVGNIEKRIGYLKYQGWWETGAFIGIMVALVIIILIIAAIVAFCCYRRYTDPHYLDLKRRASGNPYVGVPTKDRHILERINPELRLQIGKALLEDPDNLIVEEEVGKGNFGKVYSGRLLNPVTREKSHVAVKTVRGDSNVSSIEEFMKEAIVMKNFKNPNVLPLLGVVIKENIPYVILPFMDNGDLKTFVSNENNRFTVRELVSFGIDVAQGMAYLEEQRFVHRDLAARNCMVDKDKRILIADFGLARDIYVADYYRIEDKSRPLPIRWMAIESIELQKFTTKSDVWSFGIVLWELLSRGMKPYPGVDNLDIKRFLKRGDRLEKPSHSPPEVYEVMRKCWSVQPEERPTFRELVGMLDNLLSGRKPDAPPRPKLNLPAASPDSPPKNSAEGYMGMTATTPPQATYLELVDMPSGESELQGYLPMK